jgi:hypothetical protein
MHPMTKLISGRTVDISDINYNPFISNITSLGVTTSLKEKL